MQIFNPAEAEKAIDRAWSNRPIRFTDHGGGEYEIEGRHGRYVVNVAEIQGRIYYSCSCPSRSLCWHCIPFVGMAQVRMAEVVESKQAA